MRYRIVAALCPFFLLVGTAPAQPPGPFALRDGDRVVLLGGGLVEHERFHGAIETRLLRHFPGAKVPFRNLGWSGDTVRGDARSSGYQNPEGMGRLLREVRAEKPTVLFVGYGMSESFDGPAALPGFVQGLGKLLDDLAPLQARVVLLSPTFHEDLGRPFPDPTQHDRHLEAYTATVQKLARQRGLTFIDLYHPLVEDKQARPQDRLTTNGILLNALGYAHVAAAVERQLGLAPASWQVELDAAGKVRAARAAKVSGLTAAPGQVQFRLEDAMFPVDVESAPLLRISDLAAGSYALKFDGQELLTASGGEWDKGVRLTHPALFQEAEALRRAVVARNEQFYRRSRPFNDHERHFGFLRGDYKLYDEQIAAREKVIDQCRQTRAHEIEIVRKEGQR